ncbi:hypothetical protein JAAARDRAFT_38626 [Jaapia argillacea MUCL 33604]|uniref:Uncharacterized protein n=1 Tax=Jaapia argillacea MUCL 33604 TaxID=933084 RepID=A0A067PJM4_9AGAM|nr:hypothetical protein JAAARDRAFT_38626 [Jaapia argillacea MUCL 33604]
MIDLSLSLSRTTTMPPSEFSFRLQQGIAGGFAPPTPNAIYTVTASANKPSLFITSAVRPAGTPSLADAVPKSLAVDAGNTSALVDELHGILKELPTEQPPGSEDIYGLDTAIAWGSDDLEWMNGRPQGCGGGFSEVQPTGQQKEKFKRAVAIVEELVSKAS